MGVQDHGAHWWAHRPDELRKGINRVIKGLRGDAFDLAMDIGRERLMTSEGINALLDLIRKTIFPIEAQEAKILFAMGQKPHGSLARQSNESMTSYCSRRRRWWKMVKKLDKDMNLSDEMLGSLMLDHAGLTSQECLMVLTSTGNETSFDKIRDVLILQHSRIHLSGQKGDSKGFQRKPWHGSGKGKHSNENRYGYFTGHEEEWQEEENEWHGDYQVTAWNAEDNSWCDG